MKKEADILSDISLEEYIVLEETGDVRHEYYYGKLFAMPGETLLHNEICINLLTILRNIFLPKGWKLYMESVKVQIENEPIYLYPDIVLTAIQAINNRIDQYIIHQPILIAEILSDSTRKYDSTDKFIQYQKIPSLKYYLLVEPEKKVVTFYEKCEAGEWQSKVFTELTEIIYFAHMQGSIALSDIYTGI